MKNYWIIGDVAGEYDALLRLLNKLPKDAELIFVGDLNDRGPKTKEVIQFIKDRGCISLLGNHEDMFIDYVSSRLDPSGYIPQYDSSVFLYNGGIQTLKSYLGRPIWYYEDKNNEILSQHLSWLKERPLNFETDEFIVTHAPLKNGDIGKFDNMVKRGFIMDAIWNRDHIAPNSGGKFQFFGHNGVYHEYDYMRSDILVGKQKYAICVDDSRNGFLTAVNWPSLEKIQEKY